MDKGTIKNAARSVVRDTLVVVDLTNKGAVAYLEQGSFDGTGGGAVSPSGLAVGLIAIGAHFCGLDEEEIVQLLTKLSAADGVFGAEVEMHALHLHATGAAQPIFLLSPKRISREEVWRGIEEAKAEGAETLMEMADFMEERYNFVRPKGAVSVLVPGVKPI